MKAGIYENLSSAEYHADKAIGSSGLKKFGECPALYEYEYLNPNKEEKAESKFSSIGSHAHIALLEPELFASTHVIAPKMAVTNKGKSNEDSKPMNKTHSDWKNFEENANKLGKTPILYSEYSQANAMCEAIMRHDLAKTMLSGEGKNEMSFFAADPISGLMMKSRPDRLVKVPGFGVVLVDYKTTGISMGTTKQSDHAFGLGRHIQAAHHKTVTELATGGEINEVCYITQMQDAPHLVRIFRMPPEAIQIGMDERRVYLDGIAECKANGVFPDYPHIIEDMIVPRWMDYQFN
jgi:hypothetical protein